MNLTGGQLIRSLLRLEWIIILAISPFFLFPAVERIWSIISLPIFFILNWFIWRRVFPITPLNVSLLLFCIMVLVSIWATTDLVASLPKITGLLLGIMVFIITVENSNSLNGWIANLLLYCFFGFCLTGVALIGTQWSTNKIQVFNVVTTRIPFLLSGFPGAEDGFHPIEVAGSLLWIVPITAVTMIAIANKGLQFSKPGLKGVLFFLLLFALLIELFVIILAQSRSAYLGLAITGFLCLPLIFSGKKRWFIVIIILLIFGILGLSIIESDWQGMLINLDDPTILNNAGISINTLNGRIGIWTHAIDVLKDFSLTGLGLNRFRTIVVLLYPYGSSQDIGHAHNELLQAGLELGLPGLVAFSSINLCSFWMLFLLFLKADQKGAQWIASKWIVLGLFSGLFSHFLFGLTDAVALGAKPGFFFWMLLGLIVGLFQQITRFPQDYH